LCEEILLWRIIFFGSTSSIPNISLDLGEVRSTIRFAVRDSVYIKNCLLIDLFFFFY